MWSVIFLFCGSWNTNWWSWSSPFSTWRYIYCRTSLCWWFSCLTNWCWGRQWSWLDHNHQMIMLIVRSEIDPCGVLVPSSPCIFFVLAMLDVFSSVSAMEHWIFLENVMVLNKSCKKYLNHVLCGAAHSCIFCMKGTIQLSNRKTSWVSKVSMHCTKLLRNREWRLRPWDLRYQTTQGCGIKICWGCW